MNSFTVGALSVSSTAVQVHVPCSALERWAVAPHPISLGCAELRPRQHSATHNRRHAAATCCIMIIHTTSSSVSPTVGAAGHTTHRPALRKTAFLSHLYMKTIMLPRQGRDQHRESTQKKMPFFAPGLHQQRGRSISCERRARRRRLRKTQPLFVLGCFPHVCPEPVLVKRCILYINGIAKGVSSLTEHLGRRARVEVAIP